MLFSKIIQKKIRYLLLNNLSNKQYYMITFFKELLQFIKMLFTSNPSDYNKVELMEMEKFPFSGYKYMMWCGKMIYRSDKKDSIMASIGTATYIKDVTHETIHLKQAQVRGTWLNYYWKYLCEWFNGNPFTQPFNSAYYTIPFEMEAYANEDNPDYAENYNGKYLHCYDIKDRKETYRKYGNSYKWKQYIKTIEKTV